MTGGTVRHNTIVAERIMPAPPSAVFRAWADADERRRWDVPGDDWIVAEFEQDFRVGGRRRCRFGPEGSARLVVDSVFIDIVDNERIISADTLFAGGRPMTATLYTVELHPLGAGTRLVLTDQSVYFGSEQPPSRAAGRSEILTRRAGGRRRDSRGRGRTR